MAVVTENNRTVITPTAWKWYLGAAIAAALALASSVYAVLAATAFMALTGSGLVNRITLDSEGFEYRNYTTLRRYRWSDVSDFGLRIYRVNYFASTKLLTFSEASRRHTLYGKFAHAVAGGTQSVPVVGMDAKKLLGLFLHYASRAPAEAPLATSSAPAPAVPAKKASSPPVNGPVDLVMSGRSRARQTKGWPYA